MGRANRAPQQAENPAHINLEIDARPQDVEPARRYGRAGAVAARSVEEADCLKLS